MAVFTAASRSNPWASSNRLQNTRSSTPVTPASVATLSSSDMSAAMARGKCCAGAWGLWGASVGLREVFWCRRGESAVRVERYPYLYSTYRYNVSNVGLHTEKFQHKNKSPE